MPGKVDGQQSPARERPEKRDPDGCAERHAMQENECWTAAVGKHTRPQTCSGERDVKLFNLETGAGEQLGFGVVDAFLQSAGRHAWLLSQIQGGRDR